MNMQSDLSIEFLLATRYLLKKEIYIKVGTQPTHTATWGKPRNNAKLPRLMTMPHMQILKAHKYNR